MTYATLMFVELEIMSQRVAYVQSMSLLQLCLWWIYSIPSVSSGGKLSYSSAVIFDSFHKACTIWRQADPLAFPWYQRGEREPVTQFNQHTVFQVWFYILYYCHFILVWFVCSVPAPSVLFSAFYWEDNPHRNIIPYTHREEKNTNLNKYFIRLFCDLMGFCLAWVYGNISGPFINALTQWYPTQA